ncbi:MAG TPA: hypothetical protein VLW52_16195 [Opitutaceae bacterium]|nr:hypothetical protein [Opitutaceae bacterium]
MRNLLMAVFIWLLSACSREMGDAPVTRGDGLGETWVDAGQRPNLVMYAVRNSYTRDILFALESSGAHYELVVGPVRERFMVVPKGDYQIRIATSGSSAVEDYIHYYPEPCARHGVQGILIKVRP